MNRPLFAMFCLVTLLVLACGHPPPGRGAGEVETTAGTTNEQGQATAKDRVSFRVETVVRNLEVPWSIVWAPDGRMIFTERPGRVRVYENGKLQPQPIFTVPDVESRGEAGLMSIALHPQFSSNHFVYLLRTSCLKLSTGRPVSTVPAAATKLTFLS